MSSYGQSSNSTAYNPFASDILIDAYDRCGVYELENKHLISARRSLNLLLTSSWSNRGPNLWTIQEIVIPLIPGVIKYYLNRNVATVFDCFRRQYSMNGAQSYPLSFTTQINTPNVTIALPGNSSPVGSYVGVAMPVSVGGLVLYGFYLVVATPTTNSVTIQAAANATATVTAGGAVPAFTTTLGSQNVSVNLPSHGYVPGAPFPVNVSTAVGGVTLFGNYIVQSVTDANNFVIQADANALSAQTVSENAGQAWVSTQNIVAGYTDILMTQYSRTDYASQADKTSPGAPTCLWINKQITPEFSVWPVTDNTGPYEIHLWCMQQVQDVNPSGGQTLNMPPRFYYACVLDLARDLSMKFAPAKYASLKQEAMEAWEAAAETDIENTSSFFLPQLPTGLN